MKELAVVVNNDNDKSVTVYETIDAIKNAGFIMYLFNGITRIGILLKKNKLN